MRTGLPLDSNPLGPLEHATVSREPAGLSYVSSKETETFLTVCAKAHGRASSAVARAANFIVTEWDTVKRVGPGTSAEAACSFMRQLRPTWGERSPMVMEFVGIEGGMPIREDTNHMPAIHKMWQRMHESGVHRSER